MAPPRQSPIAGQPTKDERERFWRQWRELKDRYGLCWIAAEGRLSSTALERPRRGEVVEPWIGAIIRLSKAVLRADLEKMDDMLNFDSKFNFLNSCGQAFLETLKGELLPQRLTALASLRQTGIPEAVEVLGLLLRELWARVTGGNSKLCDQEATKLQRLLDLMWKAIADWERVKNPNQIEWCGHFCGPIWALRQSRGEGPPDPVDYDMAMEDLRLLRNKAQCILTTRELTVDQEGMRQNLNGLKGSTLSLKEEVKELQQDKLQMKKELERLMSEKVTEMDDKLKKMEHEYSAARELHEKLQSELLRVKDESHQLQNEQLKMNEELQQVKSENEKLTCQVKEMEENMKEMKHVQHESSAWKELHEKLENELFRLKDELMELQNEKMKTNEELQEVKVENENIKCQVAHVEATQRVQVEVHLKSLESELLNMKGELQEFRKKTEASSMKADSEKLELQRELLNIKKDLMSMKYDHLTSNDNLKMKKELAELMLHQLLHVSSCAKTEFSDVCSEASWVKIDEETSILLSASSGFSVDTSGPHCFTLDTMFKTPTGSFLSALQLLKDTQILAADGSTVLVVASPPEQHAARGMVVLEVSAAQLKVGDEVVVDGVPTKLTSVDFILGEVRVLKITFQPDEPVAVFHQPDLPVAVSQPSTHSHGHKPKKIRRGGKHYHTVKEAADAWSIPDTQGYYSD
ncbi:unnamed protein product [Durusdinium trenchii]|uniref:Uncharacterized protein n=1 Tax=Durusdinium trenchii TaxID=1381693 RepID=A0ABP0PS52_9DINO